MKPTDLLVVFALTFFAVTIAEWILAPQPLKRRPLFVVVVLLLATLWVVGVPLIVVKR